MPPAAGAQGFGVFKKTVMVSRSLPPAIDLSGHKVAVNVTAVAGRAQTVTQLFRAKIIPLIFSNGTLVEAQSNPDRVIEVTITDFTSTTRTDPQDRSQVVTATIRAAYRTIDNQTKQSLDAKNLAFDYDRAFPAPAPPQPANKGDKGFIGTLNKIGSALGSKPTAANSGDRPPTAEQLTSVMVEALAIQVAQRVVLTKESIEVALPRGKLDKTSDLAVAGRWGAMLEELEQIAPLPAGDDAYRLYGIGVANEALAYVEEDAANQRDLVANASQNYKTALKLRPDDGTLQKAENRIAQSQAALTVAAAQQSRSASAQPAAGSRATPGGSKTKTSRWENAAVIELAQAGFKDGELVDAISNAPNPEFDVTTPAGLLELRRAGVSDVVIRAMRMRMQVAPKGY